MQTAMTVSLVVKGDGFEAERETTRRLQTWLAEHGSVDCVEGEGFPVGTLLYFRVTESVELGAPYEVERVSA